MNIPEIRELCIDASEIYYQYLEENDKGVSRIQIRSIEAVDASKFKLKISQKIFDEEAISLKHIPTKKDWGIDYLHIQVYDKDSNTLIIKPDTVISDKMRGGRADDWEIISDLKFLVERVRQWYQKNGSDIRIPDKVSKLDPPPESLYFKETSFQPSHEQKQALEYIFTKPLTYIWGAPGTGKTQFVLSYAILHYLSKGKKVGIMAPTNHALEQIFRGVIKMTDKAGISRDKILRLGGPSKIFADEFPEVCELLGLEKQLEDVQKQINTLEKLLGIDDVSNEIKLLEAALKGIEDTAKEKAKLPPLKAERTQLKSSKEGFEKNRRASELKIISANQEIDRLQRKRNSILYKISKAFTGSQNLDKRIRQLQWQIVEAESGIRGLDGQIEEDQKKLTHVEALIHALQKKTAKLTETIYNSLKGTRFRTIADKNEIADSSLKSEILETIEAIKDEQPTYDSLFKEYEMHDPAYLKQKLNKLLSEKDRLLAYSTEERLKNVSILGATLDTYLYRFQENKLGVDHIFLDEAGYSNIIKAQTLFNQGVPVTFLGDHKQLPPVCELSKQDIGRNETYKPVFVWDQSALYLEDLYSLDDLDQICLRYLKSAEAQFKQLHKHSLTATYRFGNSLAKVLEKYVYPDGFKSALSTETEIIIYNTSNPAYNRNGTRKNQAEVDAIISLMRTNFDAEKSDVAVLAPYNIQVRELMRKLPDFQNHNKLMTVHKSQGQEWETVVYSVCDIGNGKRPWFTDSNNNMSNGLNNINTAVSRAKKRLILVCSEDEWRFFQGQLITGIIGAATEKLNYGA